MLMPISALPRPYSPPSAKRVEALMSTLAESTSAANLRGGGKIIGDDGIGVLTAVLRNVGDGFVDARHLLDGDDVVEKFPCPSRHLGRVWRPAAGQVKTGPSRISTFFSTEGGGDPRQDFAGNILVNKQTFLGVAQRHAIYLGCSRQF